MEIQTHQQRLERIYSHFDTRALQKNYDAISQSVAELETVMAWPDRPTAQLAQDEMHHRELTSVQREIGHRIMGQLVLPAFEVKGEA